MLTSDGTDVGYNPDSTTSRRICYTWQADQEGVFLFSDMADTRSGEDGTSVTEKCLDYMLPLIQGEVKSVYEDGMPVHFAF